MTPRPAAAPRTTALSLVLLVCCWQAASWVAGADVLAGPWSTGQAMVDAEGDGYLWSDLAVTTARLLAAFVLGFAVSLVAGLLLGLSTRVQQVFGVWLTIAASVPALVYVVFCYLVIGISNTAAVIAVALVVAPASAHAIWDGVSATDPALREMGRSFGVRRWQAMWRITVPQSVPWIFTAARSCWSLTWRIMVFVELIGRPDGVGYRIQYWFDLANLPRVMASALPLVAVIVVVDLAVFRSLEHRLAQWRPVELR